MRSSKPRRPIKSFERFIASVERIGNLLPHPFFLFIVLIVFIFFLSYFLNTLGVAIVHPGLAESAYEGKAKTIMVINLLEKGMLQSIMENFVKTFAYFTPVGFVLVMILGVGLAEQAGLFSALIRQLVQMTPAPLITFMISIASICANIASDAGIVIAPAIGAAVFLASGRHPIAGVCVGYVSAYGGYSANVLVAGTDVMLAGITQSAIGYFHIDAPVHPLMNWYVMMGSTAILALVVTAVTEGIIVPYLGPYKPAAALASITTDVELKLTADEKKGLAGAGLTSLIFLMVLVALIVPDDGFLRNERGTLLPKSPLISGIIFIIFSYFFLAGTAYGIGAKTIKNQRDIPQMMAKGLTGVAGFLVVCLPASIFIDLFHKSNLTTLIALWGARLFESVHIGVIPALLLFSLLCAGLNIFVTSGLTQWMITAPIFVPLFYQLGVSPATTQMAFRIGDSTTNIISPISAYLPMLLGLLEKYRNKDQEIGIGSALSLMLPYSFSLLVFWLIYFGIWLLLGLDPGPGVTMYMATPSG
jgi:aminobenzoyl-glutamate transport protein